MLYPVAAGAELSPGVVGSDGIEGIGDGLIQGFVSAGLIPDLDATAGQSLV